MATVVVALTLISALALSWPAQADVSGQAAVIDGDTIEVRGSRVRLHGIDAPESAQTCLDNGKLWLCGQHASRALAERVSGRSVDCKETAKDNYGRIVAVCLLGGTDLNAWMVAQGWALAYRRYSSAYAGEEASAKAARRGIWRGDFVAPWDWRAGIRNNRDRGRNTGECRIKGNIGRDGARIYHVPSGKYYERTRISPSKGERWFCSEAEARSAGWRKSRR